jgi:hypothetical protein
VSGTYSWMCRKPLRACVHGTADVVTEGERLLRIGVICCGMSGHAQTCRSRREPATEETIDR